MDMIYNITVPTQTATPSVLCISTAAAEAKRAEALATMRRSASAHAALAVVQAAGFIASQEEIAQLEAERKAAAREAQRRAQRSWLRSRRTAMMAAEPTAGRARRPTTASKETQTGKILMRKGRAQLGSGGIAVGDRVKVVKAPKGSKLKGETGIATSWVSAEQCWAVRFADRRMALLFRSAHLESVPQWALDCMFTRRYQW